MLSKAEQLVLLEMLKLKNQNISMTFKNQKEVRSQNFFYNLMTNLFKKELVSKINNGREKAYEFTDYGYNRAIEISEDFDTPEKYKNVDKNKVIFMIVPKWF
jgi:predicted transcriptional regulator